ncbi:MAG: tetratricopeptide repeat protein, partial [Planctomycetota bacterium]|nr:tetratricopeptide repeat protein [Planctomycetota bacterium]
ALRIYVELSPLDYNYADNAIELLGYAREIDPENWDAAIEYVRVFRVEKQRAMAKARTILQTTDKRNPELADLYVEVARSVRIGFNEGEARRYAETALRINPNHAGARAIIARVLLEDNEYGAADDQITAGLEFNHKHRELLALKATLELLTGDNEAFEKGMKDLLAIDPTYGEGFHIAALVVAARQRRYDRAAALTRRALQIDAMNTDAHASLGIFLANLGRAEEAIAALSKSRKLFPFSHPIRDNFRDVLDYVTKTMVEQKTKHFVIRYDPTEYDITSLFLPQLLEGCWDDMTKRYGFTPKAPVLVEVFKKADDFSVRTMGILGIPALGACFGGLITLDSPQALGPNQFSWAATARHEFGHVMSLQISGGQVPRWFTEGLSVFEEKPLDPGWGLNEAFERQIHTAYHTDSLPKIGKFDAMFRTNRVAFAYHVGGLMIDFLHKRSGEKGIVKALELYGKHRPTREVFKKAFDLELEDFDALFLEYVGKRVEGYKIVPRYGWVRGKLAEQVSKNPKDGEALVKLAWAHFQARRNVDAGVYLDRAKDILVPGHLSATLLQARLAQRAGRGPQARKLIEQFFAAGGEDFDARMIMAAVYRQGGETAKYIDFLNKAKAAWPLNVTGNNPYVLLRRYYLQESRNDDALKELEGQTRIASVNLNIRLVLAREYMGAGRLDDAIKLLDEALNLHTFDRRVHTMMVAAARQKKLWPRALRSGRCLVRLLPGDADGEETAIAWAKLGELFLEAGEVDEAQRALKEAEKQAEGIDVPAVGKLKEKLDQGR